MSPPPETILESQEPRGQPRALSPEGETQDADGAPETLPALPAGSAEASKAVADFNATIGSAPVPAAWELTQRNNEVQENIQKLTDAIAILQGKTAQLPDKTFEPEGPFQEHLKGIGQGTEVMDMRGAAGRFFYKELKLDKQLQAEWEKVGKRIDKQRDFKQKWCKTRYETIVQSRTKRESSFDLQSVDAEYCVFSRIVQREGGDVPAFVTAQTFVRNAMVEWQAKRLFHGHPWVKHDAMRGGAVVLHYREKLSSGTSTTWQLQTSESTTHHVAAANAPGSSSDTPKRPQEEEEPPLEPVPKKGKKNSKASAAATAATAAAIAAAAAAATDEETLKKNLQAALRKASALKLDVSKATQAGSDILTLVANNADWAWCNNDALLGPIRRCLLMMGEWKKSTKFWQAWTVEDNLGAYCRKHFKPEQVIAAITQAHRDDEDGLRKLTDRLQSNTIKLNRMQASKNLDD